MTEGAPAKTMHPQIAGEQPSIPSNVRAVGLPMGSDDGDIEFSVIRPPRLVGMFRTEAEDELVLVVARDRPLKCQGDKGQIEGQYDLPHSRIAKNRRRVSFRISGAETMQCGNARAWSRERQAFHERDRLDRGPADTLICARMRIETRKATAPVELVQRWRVQVKILVSRLMGFGAGAKSELKVVINGVVLDTGAVVHMCGPVPSMRIDVMRFESRERDLAPRNQAGGAVPSGDRPPLRLGEATCRGAEADHPAALPKHHLDAGVARSLSEERCGDRLVDTGCRTDCACA